MRSKPPGEYLIMKPAMIAAKKMPVPAADKKLKLKIAFSGVGDATTGGTRETSLCKLQTGILGAAIPSKKLFVCGRPQMKTTTLRTIQGSQGRNIADFRLPISNCSVSEARPSGRATSRDDLANSLVTFSPSVALPNGRASETLQIFFGCQNFRNNASAPMEQIAAVTSTNHGPWKFETRNCGIAKHAPATRIAGQMSSIPRKPANAQINQNGTSSEKNGSCRPTIALSCFRSNPVTPCRPINGAPRAPNATGAVLAINERPDAESGEKPNPIKIAPVTATGVPNPQAPSMNAPKLKATSSSCNLLSSVKPVML